MAVILGIDPGLSGAWAAYPLNGGPIHVGDLPVSGTGAQKQVEGALLAATINAFDVEAVVVELVGPQPRDGAVQAFKFGLATGEAVGVVKTLGLPLFRVAPAVWKRHFGLIGKDKEASRQTAIHRFPSVATSLARKKDDGRAEALLIAAHHAHTKIVKAAA